MSFRKNYGFWLRALSSAIFYGVFWKQIPWAAVRELLFSAQLGWIGLALALFWGSLELKRRGLAPLNMSAHAGVVRWHEALMAWLLALAAGFLNQPLNALAGFPLWFYAVGWAFVTTLLVAGNRLFFRGQAHPSLLLVALSVQAIQVSAGLCLMYAVGAGTRPLEYAMLLAGAQVLAPLTLAGAGFREALFVLGFEYLPIEIGQGVAVSLLGLGLLGLAWLIQFRRRVKKPATR
ncbi:MAG: hypothetical protein LH606_10925 [Cytophagaceae bacterium]|nr:hypothetical protein [Cytophagaceae bacterium]